MSVDLTMIEIESGGELDPPALVCHVPGCKYRGLFDRTVTHAERMRWYGMPVGEWVLLAEKHLDTHRAS